MSRPKHPQSVGSPREADVLCSRNSNTLESTHYANQSADFAWQLLINALSIHVCVSCTAHLTVSSNAVVSGTQSPHEIVSSLPSTTPLINHTVLKTATRFRRVTFWPGLTIQPVLPIRVTGNGPRDGWAGSRGCRTHWNHLRSCLVVSCPQRRGWATGRSICDGTRMDEAARRRPKKPRRRKCCWTSGWRSCHRKKRCGAGNRI